MSTFQDGGENQEIPWGCGQILAKILCIMDKIALSLWNQYSEHGQKYTRAVCEKR